MLVIYMTVKEFATKNHLSNATVRRYCKNGMIIGAEKVMGVWKIPDDSIKPLTDKQTRQMLLSLLLLKNTVAARPDFTSAGCGEADIPRFFKYLSYRNLILGFNIKDGDRIPIKSYVSDAGINFLFNHKDRTQWIKMILKFGVQFLSLVLQAVESGQSGT